MRIASVALLFGALFFATPAKAVEVYFNGVKVTGIKSQSFSQCAVRFDQQGNIHITAKGYTVKAVNGEAASVSAGSSTPAREESKVTKNKYFLVSQTNAPGKIQYDVAVYLNGHLIRRIHDTSPQVVMDIGSHLTKDEMSVEFVATKSYRDKPRASRSASDYLRVFIGQGKVNGERVDIEHKLAEIELTAAQTDNRSERALFRAVTP